MAALAFDTLDASKTLRNAGVDERTAEAIVQIVQRTTEMPDISHLATKEDLNTLEQRMIAGQERLGREFGEKLRVQGWQLLGGMGALIAVAVAIIKLVP